MADMTRNQQIVKMRECGCTYKTIAKTFSLSPGRIPQILKTEARKQRDLEWIEAIEWEMEWRTWLPLFQKIGQSQ